MYKIGLSTPCGHITEENLASYRAAGLTVMEISDRVEGYADFDYEHARTLADQYGIKLHSMHLPFMPFTQIDISSPALADDTVEYYRELIEKGASIGIKIFVLHPSGEPIKDEERSIRMETAKKTLARLAEIAKANDAVIAVENLPRSCLGKNSAEIAELLSVHEALRACFDTNHLLSEPLADFMRNMKDRIITTHISDYDFVNERHWLPGEGKIDWQEILSILTEIGYQGPWMYELSLVCPKTILRNRSLCHADLMRNAQELFDGKTLTVISQPKPNLGWWE